MSDGEPNPETRKGAETGPVQGECAWYCVRTQTKREALVAGSLRAQGGLEILCPQIRFRKLTKRGPVWFTEALFPSYLFARFDYFALHRMVRHTTGVVGIVQFGDHVATVADALVNDLRTAYPSERGPVEVEIALEADALVRVAGGKLLGMDAIVNRVIPGGDRVVILMEFLGRTVKAETSAANVMPVASPREVALGAAIARRQK